MDWYVIIIIVAFLVVVFILDLKILFYYEHPDDSRFNQGFVAKLTTLVGLEFVWLLLTCIPTDAFNSNSGAGLDMQLFWKLVLPFILLYLIFPVPFATSFYEADTDPRTTKTPAWVRALKFTSIVFVCCFVIITVMYFALRSTKVLVCDPDCVLEPKDTPFFDFSAILVGFFGWILVVLFLGVGLVAVPQGLIFGFINRPKAITQQDYKYVGREEKDQRTP